MSHLSIAIIKKPFFNEAKEIQLFEYLVQKNEKGDEFMFFDSKDLAINGSFNFSEFKNKIIRYFDLPRPDKSAENDFVKAQFFKSNKRDPYATAYEYELSGNQIKEIDKKLKANQGIWPTVLWIKEENLSKHLKNWKKEQKFIFGKEVQFKTPKFSNELRTSLRNIVKANQNKKLVIFAGAGVSVDSSVPSWSELINEHKNDLDVIESDYLKLGDLYFESRGNKEYQERVQYILKYGRTRFNPLHQKIIECGPIHIITTNYDQHFEQVINELHYGYSIVKKDPDLPYTNGDSLFIKMHGDFSEKNIVLRKYDYDNYKVNFPLIESYIKAIFSSKLVLFIGFSFTDPNLKMILDSVSNILGENVQRPYLLTTNKKKKEKEILEEFGLKVIEYEETPIESYYNQIKNEDDINKAHNLGLIGQKVYKFLKVIENFDIVSDTLENLNVENQLIHSLSRFNELGAIPQKVLENISPFRLKKHSETGVSTNAHFDSTNPFQLKTLNEELLHFLKQNQNSSSEIEVQYFDDIKKSSSERAINKALKLLYSSGVNYIIRKNDTSPERYKFKAINSEEKCNCYRCLYDRFDFIRLINDLNSASGKNICKQANQNIDLREAYGFFKTGQFLKAFYALEEIKNQSSRSQKYITFFLASYNQTLLQPFCYYSYNKFQNEDELDLVREKIKKINLDKLLYELPVDEDVKEALKIIKEKNNFTNAEAIIEDNHTKIIDLYKKFSKGEHYHIGPYYWHIVESHFYLVWEFYHNNMLYFDEYRPFIKLAQVYLESIIASYATSYRYSDRIKKISPFFYLVLLMNGNSEDIKSLFIKYKISKLNFENPEETKQDIIEEFLFFLESGYIESSFFRKEISKNETFSFHIENSTYFENKLNRILSNFLILITKIDVKENEINKLLTKIMSYLSVSESFAAHNSLKYFLDFLVTYINEINEKNIIQCTIYILSDNIWSDDLIEQFCNALVNRKKINNLLGEDIYIKILRRVEPREKWNIHLHEVIPFYPLLKEEQKDNFQNVIVSHLLNDTFNYDAIRISYNWGVWNPKNNNEVFNIVLDKIIGESKGFPDYKISDDGLPININNFSTWNKLIFLTRLVYKYDLFDNAKVYNIFKNIDSKMFRWILNPKEFDYNSFKSEWVLVFPLNLYIKKIGKIPNLNESIKSQLIENYNPQIAKIFFKKILNFSPNKARI